MEGGLGLVAYLWTIECIVLAVAALLRYLHGIKYRRVMRGILDGINNSVEMSLFR